MKNFTTRVQDEFINTIRKRRVPVIIFLKSGQSMKGIIESYDQFTIKISLLGKKKIPGRKNTEKPNDLIYKSNILTIVPVKKVKVKL